jgi:TfoX/Sxy family transcriptional regulator of competence genes
MGYSAVLDEQVEGLTCLWQGLERKKMFGGICYLIQGNMAFGIWKESLIVRMAPDRAAREMEKEHVRAFDITGKPMKGWVLVEKGAWDRPDELARWLELGRAFALSLPAKRAERRSLEEIYYKRHR